VMDDGCVVFDSDIDTDTKSLWNVEKSK